MAKRQTHRVFVRVSNVNDFIYVIKLQSFISDYRPSCMHCFELYICLRKLRNCRNDRCHGLSVYPVCVCNTVRLGQDTT